MNDQRKQFTLPAPIAVFLAIIATIVIMSLFIESPAHAELTPLTEPSSGTILMGIEAINESEITVTAPYTDSCVVKLKTSDGVTRVAFYVRAGETATIGVPCEYLYVLFASGDTWYGMNHYFGDYTHYSMDDEIQDFKNYTWEYTLVPANDGNFEQTPIDAETFG